VVQDRPEVADAVYARRRDALQARRMPAQHPRRLGRRACDALELPRGRRHRVEADQRRRAHDAVQPDDHRIHRSLPVGLRGKRARRGRNNAPRAALDLGEKPRDIAGVRFSHVVEAERRHR
jgi:hypothetical protein